MPGCLWEKNFWTERSQVPAHPQVIRTAEMLDIVCVIFVRRKHPDETILAMAKERELIVMETGHRMFSTCGMLYKAGLGGGAV